MAKPEERLSAWYRDFLEARKQGNISSYKGSQTQENFEEEETRKEYNNPLGPKKTTVLQL